MKTFPLFIFAAIILPFAAQASSLDDLLKTQYVEKIEPVTMSGVSIDGRLGAAVCGALGFSRLVSVETEPCLLRQEDLMWASMAGGVVEFLGKVAKCGESSSQKLMSVTCAR